MNYQYLFKVIRVIDGDTILGDIYLDGLPNDDATSIDCGFNCWATTDGKTILKCQRIRLAGLNAPEMGTAEGKISFEWLKTQVQGAVVTLITIKAKNTSKTDIYGRYIGFIKLRERDINKELISLGYAEARYY